MTWWMWFLLAFVGYIVFNGVVGAIRGVKKRTHELNEEREELLRPSRHFTPEKLKAYHEKFGPEITTEHLGEVAFGYFFDHLPPEMEKAPRALLGKYFRARFPSLIPEYSINTPDSLFALLEKHKVPKDQFKQEFERSEGTRKFFIQTT